MKEIKLKTKVNGVLLKMPDGVSIKSKVDLLGYLSAVGKLWLKMHWDKYKFVGNPFSLLEEQAQEIVDDVIPKSLGLYPDYSFKQNRLKAVSYLDTAMESWLSLMAFLKVYKENPYGENPRPKECICSDCQSDNNEFEKEWEEAQERTGNWILLIEINP